MNIRMIESRDAQLFLDLNHKLDGEKKFMVHWLMSL